MSETANSSTNQSASRKGVYKKIVTRFKDPIISTKKAKISKHLELVHNQARWFVDSRKQSVKDNLEITKQTLCRRASDSSFLLALLPVEIWKMVLEKLNDVDDLKNVMHSSSLFDRLLQDAKPVLLFEKIFSFIFPYGPSSGAFTCREVCKEWSRVVGTVFENHLVHRNFISPTYTNSSSAEILCHLPSFEYSDLGTGFYVFEVPCTYANRGRPKCEPLINARYSRNPLIGKTVHVSLHRVHPVLTSHLKSFLRKFGPMIYHMKIEFDLFDCSNKSASDIYLSFVQILNGCANLKSLYFHQNRLRDQREKYGSDDMSIFEMNPPNHSKLETLSVLCDFQNKGILTDKLITKYGSQLIQVFISHWNPNLYKSLNWENLNRLSINMRNMTDDELKSLSEIRAVNLKSFGILLTGNNVSLATLIQVVQNFQSLQMLEIICSQTCRGFRIREIIALPPNLSTCMTVQNLILTGKSGIFSVNFLVCFPMLRKLKIVHEDNHLGFPKSSLINFMHFSSEIRYGKLDYTTMYQSNIWKVLPFLQVIHDLYTYSRSYVYYRHFYETKNNINVLDAVFKMNIKTANFFCKKMQAMARGNLKQEQCKLEQQAVKATSQQTISLEQVVYLILPYLSKLEFLRCRSVSKSLKSIVDNIQENLEPDYSFGQELGYFAKRNWEAALHLLRITHIIQISQYTQKTTKIEAMKAMVPTNPLIGGRVELRLPQRFFTLVIKNQIINFLETFGKHIHHLKIHGTSTHGITIGIVRYSSDVFANVLKFCANLKSYSDENLQMVGIYYMLNRGLTVGNTKYEIVPHNNLQSLKFGQGHSGVGKKQIALLLKFHNQLKYVCIDSLNFFLDYENPEVPSWDNLVDLELTRTYCISEEDYFDEEYGGVNISGCWGKLYLFFKLNAPNLTVLRISIKGGVKELTTLIKLTHHFKKLSTLALKLAENRIDSENQIAVMTPGFVSSTQLCFMELYTTTELLSYNFLTFFPFVRRLKVYKCNTEQLIQHRDYSDDFSYSADEISDSDNEEEMYKESGRLSAYKDLQESKEKYRESGCHRRIKLLQFPSSNSFTPCLQNEYDQIVWKVLPMLQCFEIFEPKYEDEPPTE